MKTTNLLKTSAAAIVAATLFAGHVHCMNNAEATIIHTADGEMDISISESMSFEEGVKKAIEVYDRTQRLFQLQEIAEIADDVATKLSQVLEKNKRYDLIMRLNLKEKESINGLIEYFISPEAGNFPTIEATNISGLAQSLTLEEIDKCIQYVQTLSSEGWRKQEVMACLLLCKMGKQIAQRQQERGRQFQENRFKVMDAMRKPEQPSHPSARRR